MRQTQVSGEMGGGLGTDGIEGGRRWERWVASGTPFSPGVLDQPLKSDVCRETRRRRGLNHGITVEVSSKNLVISLDLFINSRTRRLLLWRFNLFPFNGKQI